MSDQPPRLHFISGLPRSGSTLLAGLLRQNPRFHAGISSPLCSLFSGLLNGMAAEGAGGIDEARRARVLRGLLDSYYADRADKGAVFDTNRMWTARLPALVALYPEVKVVCMVRNVAWIMDSIERLVRGNALLPSRLFAEPERANVYARVDALAARDRLVGAAWSALKEAFYGAEADRLLIVDYDYLARAPARVMALIYQFLDEESFIHDFENVEYEETEFDLRLTTPGLHRVARRVRATERPTILPPDIFARFAAMSFWADTAPSRANLLAPSRRKTEATAA